VFRDGICPQAEVANRDGNTPLHYACQYCPSGKTFTINKLLQQNCNVLIANVAGDTPFDLAVRFNKIGESLISFQTAHHYSTYSDVVPLLIDSDARTLKQAKPIVEAAKNGQSSK